MATGPSIGGGLAVPVASPMGYVAVPASATNQALGPSGGAVSDYLHAVVIIPGTTAAGAVSIKDGGGAPITIFIGGTGSVADLKSFLLPVNLKSVSGSWQISTGANVSALAIGSFT